MIYVINKIKCITELNPKNILNGFFAVKNVGILFQCKVSMSLVELESQNYKIKRLEYHKVEENKVLKINNNFSKKRLTFIQNFVYFFSLNSGKYFAIWINS